MTALRLTACFKLLVMLAAVLGPSAAWALPWWNCDWHYRTEITVQSTQSVSDRVVHFDLSGANFNAAYAFTPDGADLRVLDTDNNTSLDFHVEDWDAAARSAILTLRMPSLAANIPRTVYLYYGNTLVGSGASAVPTGSDPQSTFPSSGWRYHVRSSTLNPSNEAQARAEFEGASEPSGYGCAVVNQVQGLNKRNSFGGSNGNYGLYAETHFEVTTPGIWKFRAGVDFGRGGGFYLNHQPLVERWNEDLWWSMSFNNSDVLTGSVNLSAGYHHIEALGFEGCCDGTISVQYQSPGSSVWRQLNSANLNLVNPGCPVGVQSFQYQQTDSPNRFGGQAFLDNGDNGIAHNGAREGNEGGLASIDVTVEVVDSGAINTVSSDANGSWHTCFLEEAAGSDVEVSMPTPADHYSVSESASVSNSDLPLNGVLRFPVVGDNNYLDLTTGFIALPELVADNAIEVGAGLTGLLAHRYIPSSDADVSFQVSQLQHQQAGVYSYLVFEDLDCNGELDTPAAPLSSPIPVQLGQDVCMVIKVDGGSLVVDSSLLELRIDAISDFSGINLSHNNANTDMVTGAVPIAMMLNKTVCNASQDTCDLASGNGFAVTNDGKPEDELVYRLEFLSQFSTLRNVAVYDNIPAYTKLKPSSITVVAQPPGMNCTIVEPVDQTVTNFTGTVKWECSGQVNATQSGVLGFSVLID